MPSRGPESLHQSDHWLRQHHLRTGDPDLDREPRIFTWRRVGLGIRAPLSCGSQGTHPQRIRTPEEIHKPQIRQILSGLPFGEKLDVVLAKRVIRHGKLAVYVQVEALFAIYSKALRDITTHGATTPTYFEAGVFAGDSMATWWRAVDAAEVPMRAFGADSFQGLPPEVESDEGN